MIQSAGPPPWYAIVAVALNRKNIISTKKTKGVSSKRRGTEHAVEGTLPGPSRETRV